MLIEHRVFGKLLPSLHEAGMPLLAKVQNIDRLSEKALTTLERARGGQTDSATRAAKKVVVSLTKLLSAVLDDLSEKVAESKVDVKEYPTDFARERVVFWQTQERQLQVVQELVWKDLLQSVRAGDNYSDVAKALGVIRGWSRDFLKGGV